MKIKKVAAAITTVLCCAGMLSVFPEWNNQSSAAEAAEPLMSAMSRFLFRTELLHGTARQEHFVQKRSFPEMNTASV